MKSKEFRKEIADTFIEGLKNDGLEWKQGWIDVTSPKNGISGHKYKGINNFYLSLKAYEKGYQDSRWLTFNQIKAAGYSLEKGSKGEKVEYWFPYDLKDQKSISFKKRDELIKSGQRVELDFSLHAKYYTVFNGDCIKGLPEEVIEKNDIEPSKVLEQISEGMNVGIYNDGGNRAFYSFTTDTIHLPEEKLFISTEDYNAVAFHELAHSTGHETRLNRDTSVEFGSESYAKEELVAEITSAFMAADIGISVNGMDNHQAYINGWIEEIEKSPEVLIKAISKAEEAANYMEQYILEIEHNEIRENKRDEEYEF